MTMEAWMEVLPPKSPCFSNSSGWFPSQKRIVIWTEEENKVFEDALARFDGDAPDRWEKVASLIPGKTVDDVITHYQDLENDVNYIDAGFMPCSPYENVGFTLDFESSHSFGGPKQSYYLCGKRSGGGASDQERKKGIPWSKEEHERFLLGLDKFGKGDWRNISRTFVKTRTPTQVASHAQKFFIRHNSSGNDKRRSSIHDITTVNLPDDGPPSPSVLTMPLSSAASPALSDHYPNIFDSNQPNEAAILFKQLENGDRLIQAPFGLNLYDMMMGSSHDDVLCDYMSNH